MEILLLCSWISFSLNCLNIKFFEVMTLLEVVMKSKYQDFVKIKHALI